jgi:positive regulator of sigma E activity
MRTKATVTEIVDENIAVVLVARRSACDGCHKAEGDKGCSVCTLLGGNGEARTRAKNTAGARKGDTVAVESRTRRILSYAALVFMMPVLLSLVGYAVGVLAGLGEGMTLLTALGGFVLSFLVIYLYSRLVVAHRLDVEIVEIIESPHQGE